MAKREKQSKKDSAKLLDAWVPPPSAGEPRGCLATSFTFNAAFFEEECLGRFVGLEADAGDQPVAFLIEREEKLAQVYAGALVDRHHCRGLRSLRWDLMPVAVPGGIQHAKLALLHWTNVVRVIVGSANLTEDGYRRNREIFGVIDFRDGAAAPRALLDALIAFCRDLLRPAYTLADDAARERAEEFLGNAVAAASAWNINRVAAPALQPVFVGPRRDNLVAQIASAWPAAAGVPQRVDVLSPFFDPPESDASAPTAAVCQQLLRKRGGASLAFHVQAEGDAEKGPVHVWAPAAIVTGVTSGVEASVAVVAGEEGRPLHAKSLLVESERALGLVVGSSNFTSAGLGLRARDGWGTNFEANLLYILNLERDGGLERRLRAAFLAGTPLKEGVAITWSPATEAAEDEAPPDAAPLPAAFRTAVLRTGPAGATRLELTLSDPPLPWRLWVDESDEVLCESATAAGAATLTFPWAVGRRPPSGLTVSWGEPARRAWWPVTVESVDTLPPVEELRNLPLDVLLEVLTSARPFHRNEALLKHLARSVLGTDATRREQDPELDPHRRVDTSSFLLQRTRRVGWGLAGLRERLQRPALSAQALHWRLRGPWGPLALADAIQREARTRREAGMAATETEEAFLLAELMLELAQVQPEAHAHSVSPATVRRELRRLIADLQQRVPSQPPDSPIADYLTAVRKELER